MILDRYKSLYHLLEPDTLRTLVAHNRDEMERKLAPLLIIRGGDEYSEEVRNVVTDMVQTIEALKVLQNLLVYQLDRLVVLTTKKKGANWLPSLDTVRKKAKPPSSQPSRKG